MTSAKKRLVGLGLFGVGLSAAAGSGVGLWGLAGQVGYPIGLRWILWLSLDAYGLLAGLVWALATTGGLRRYAATNTIIAVALSILGNGLYHALTAPAGADGAPLVRVNVWIVMATTGVPPAVVAAVVHMWIMLGRSAENSAERSGTTSGREWLETPVVVPPIPAPFVPGLAAEQGAEQVEANGAGTVVLTSDNSGPGAEQPHLPVPALNAERQPERAAELDAARTPELEDAGTAESDPPSSAPDAGPVPPTNAPRRTEPIRGNGTRGRRGSGRNGLRAVRPEPVDWVAWYVEEHGGEPTGKQVGEQYGNTDRWGRNQLALYRAAVEATKGAVGQ